MCCMKLDCGLHTPLPLLEVHHRGWDKEAMAAGGRADACNIKMWSTGIGLFNGLVCVAGTRLFTY